MMKQLLFVVLVLLMVACDDTGPTAPAGSSQRGRRMLRCRSSMTIRGERRKGEVLIRVDGPLLDWRSSLAVRNHPPTGAAWGYRGSGPAQLSLAILLAVTDRAIAERFCHRFKWDVIAPSAADRWALDAAGVLSWLDSAASGTDGVVHLTVVEKR